MTYKIAILSLVALQALTFTHTAPPPCICVGNMRLVCGSDGKTYYNECRLNCERHKTGAELTVKKDGACDADRENCKCTFEYKPVCGNDGNTYANRCSLLCQRMLSPDIDVVSEGECNAVTVAEPRRICTEDCSSGANIETTL